MREINKGRMYLVEFNSINDFYKYITNTEYNLPFKNSSKSSINNTERFTKTKTFEEAVDLLYKGWHDMAKTITQRLKQEEGRVEPTMVSKNVVSVQGYHPIVPLYLNNVPNNMVSKKVIPVRQKIMTLNKTISYSATVSSDTIISESIKALRIIKKFESQNYRCNLNVVMGSSNDDIEVIAKVRIKSSNEKLNVSKLAFPLVHPSMLRRLMFRFIEVYPHITNGFVFGYGMPLSSSRFREIFGNKEYLLPDVIYKDIDKIRDIKDLEKI